MTAQKWYVRWMIRADHERVVAMEQACFPRPWTGEDFLRCLRQRNCIGMVVEDVTDTVRGYMVYELHRTRLHVLNFAVDPAFRRQGFGTAMIAKLAGKLSPQRREKILLEANETNLGSQHFFKAMGFRAISVLKDFYLDEPGIDAYLMEYRYGSGPFLEKAESELHSQRTEILEKGIR